MKPASLPLLLLSFALFAQTARCEDSPRLDSIRWILGDWTRVKEKTMNRESWKDAGSGIFKGAGSVLRRENQEVLSRESLLLVEMGNEVFYLAKVKQN
ncbi:MAG: hypothetical protein AAFU85_33105, partial [Planctomycetota bacterium]